MGTLLEQEARLISPCLNLCWGEAGPGASMMQNYGARLCHFQRGDWEGGVPHAESAQQCCSIALHSHYKRLAFSPVKAFRCQQ